MIQATEVKVKLPEPQAADKKEPAAKPEAKKAAQRGKTPEEGQARACPNRTPSHNCALRPSEDCCRSPLPLDDGRGHGPGRVDLGGGRPARGA